MALEWIQSNIKFFSGDPNNVTLLGSSSGASVIHFLMLSPAVKDGKVAAKPKLRIEINSHQRYPLLIEKFPTNTDLFHKVVLMGHYAFNPSVTFRDEHLNIAASLAHSLDYTDDDQDRKKMLKYLKSLDYEKFAKIMKFYENKSDKVVYNLRFEHFISIKAVFVHTTPFYFFKLYSDKSFDLHECYVSTYHRPR